MSEYTKDKLQQQKYQDCLKSQTLEEMTDKYIHIKRVADGSSKLQLTENPNDERFADVYPEFLQTFSRGQLQYLEKTFLAADLDHDCKLNKVELMKWMEQQGCPINQEELRDIFSQADTDRDGYLSFQEFVTLCQNSRNPDLTNIPSQSKFVASHTFQPNLENCTCSTSSRNNNTNSRGQDEDCARHFDHQSGSDNTINSYNGLSKFSNAIQPGLIESGRVNIQQSVKYFECEISKENRSKDNAIQTGQFLNEGKQRLKSKNASSKHRNHDDDTKMPASAYSYEDENLPASTYNSEANHSRSVAGQQKPKIYHSNQANYAGHKQNFQLSDRLLKATRRINPSQNWESTNGAEVSDLSYKGVAQLSQAFQIPKYDPNSDFTNRNDQNGVKKNSLQSNSERNPFPQENNDSTNKNASRTSSLEPSERRRSSQNPENISTIENPEFRRGSLPLPHKSSIPGGHDESSRRRSSQYQENISPIENPEFRRGSLPLPPKSSIPGGHDESNRRRSEPYGQTEHDSNSVPNALDSQRKRSSGVQQGKRGSAGNDPSQVLPSNEESTRSDFSQEHVRRSSVPNPVNFERRPSPYQEATQHRTSLPNPTTQINEYETSRRSTFPNPTVYPNRNSLLDNNANGLQDYPTYSPRISVPSQEPTTNDFDAAPLVPDYLFPEEQNNKRKDSSESRKNSFPISTEHKQSYSEDRKNSNRNSLNGETPLVPDYLFSEDQNIKQNTNQDSTGSRRYSDPISTGRKASDDQNRRHSNPTSVTGPQHFSTDKRISNQLKPFEQNRPIPSDAFKEARETFNVAAPPPIPDDEWLSGIQAKRGVSQETSGQGSQSRRRSTLEDIDKDARRSSILGSLAAQRGSLIPKDAQESNILNSNGPTQGSRSRQTLISSRSRSRSPNSKSFFVIDEASFTHENVPAVQSSNVVRSNLALNSTSGECVNCRVTVTNSKLYLKPDTMNVSFNKLVDHWEKASNRAFLAANKFSMRRMNSKSRVNNTTSSRNNLTRVPGHERKWNQALSKSSRNSLDEAEVSSQNITIPLNKTDLEGSGSDSKGSIVVRMIKSFESMSKTSIMDFMDDDDDD